MKNTFHFIFFRGGGGGSEATGSIRCSFGGSAFWILPGSWEQRKP